MANPDHHGLAHLESIIREKLIDGLWFYANQWGVPDLHTRQWDDELDHPFHEFESLAYTNEPVSAGTACSLLTECQTGLTPRTNKASS